MKFRLKSTMLTVSAQWMIGMLDSMCLVTGPALASDEFDYFRAVQFNDVTTIQKLLPKLGPNLREEQRGENGLILALREDAMNSFKALLAAPGIDVELRANNGNTALMMA